MEQENHMKQARTTFSQLGWCYIAGTVAVYLLEAVLLYFIERYKPEWTNSNTIMMIFSILIVYGCAMPLIALLVKGMEAQQPKRYKMRWWQFLLAFVMCYAMVFISNLLGIGITAVVAYLKGSAVTNQAAMQVVNGNLLINFVGMVILAPVIEELVFRKLIVDRTIKYGQGIAILTSGLMFGLFHGNLNQFAYAVVLGCFFAFLYVRTGNVKITIGLHAIINFMGSMVAGGLMKLMGYEKLLTMDPQDTDAIMAMVSEHIVGWVLFGAYGLFLFIVVLTGLVFIILSIPKMRTVRQETDLPTMQGLGALFSNPGMIVFFVVWVVLIVIQLFS